MVPPTRGRRRASARPFVVAWIACIAIVLGLLAAAPVQAAPVESVSDAVSSVAATGVVKTADLSKFQAGNIISDAVFFNSSTMSAAQIQSFLEGKVPRCETGYTCLKDKYDTSRTTSSDAMCGAYSGGYSERASTIIYKVAQACGINPQVILATLEKEQGLVTHVWPSEFRYTIAMGQGCPDTAACDTRYYGFFNQVYGAAWQLKRYANPSGTSQYFTWYAPGKTWNIQWSPDASCGSSPVYVQNQATANLYYYTPYQPNAASIRAGYGEGDACSTYGNRNFYQRFTDWFGSTTGSDGPAAISNAYARYGGAGGALGAVTGPVICGLAQGGCYGQYANGQIHWTVSTGAFATRGNIGDAWRGASSEKGALGYPTTDQLCVLVNGGCYQEFEHGQMHWSPSTGAQATTGAILAEWKGQSSESGPLGYPISAQTCGLKDGGCYQDFQGGQVHWSSATGAHATRNPILGYWQTRGSEKSTLGYPKSDATCGLKDGGCYQDFQGGLVHWTQATGVHATQGETLQAWAGADYEHGSLGYPTSDDKCDTASGACRQDFQGGRIYWRSATSALSIVGPILAKWVDSGAEAGTLGYPLSSTNCRLKDGGCYQDFQGGQIHWSSATGAHITRGDILTSWQAVGSERSSLGYPTGDQACGLKDGGCYQDFQGGQSHWSPATGARASRGPILAAWQSLGSEKSTLGYPTASETCGLKDGGCYQDFQGGLIHWSPATGAHATQGSILRAWAASNYENGRFGYPTADQSCTGSTCTQKFQGGTLP